MVMQGIPFRDAYLKLKNKLSEDYIEKLKKHPSVYYPILSELFSIYVFFWVRKRSKKIS